MEDISKCLAATHRRQQIFYTERFKALEITGGQSALVSCICEKPGQTQDVLARELVLDKSTVAKTIAHLEATGLITKTVSEHDKRAFNIFPTEKALAAYPEIEKVKNEWHDSITKDLSDIERDVFEKLLKKVMENTADCFRESFDRPAAEQKPIQDVL